MRDRSSILGPLSIWLAAQLAALAMAAGQATFGESFPLPAERMALHELIFTQIALSSLLFPLLLGHWTRAMAVIAASWPFVQLAGLLSALPDHRIYWAGGYVTAWLAALSIWAHLLRSNFSRLIAVAAAALLSLGGALLWYLRAEFSAAGAPARPEGWGPILGAWSILGNRWPGLRPWWPIVLAAAGGLAVPALGWIWRQFIHKVIHRRPISQPGA